MKKGCAIYFFCLIIGFFLFCCLGVEAANFVNPTAPGYRYYSQDFNGDAHEGIDITGKSAGLIEGKPAFAAKDGKVIYADWQEYKYREEKGKRIPITDENGNPIPEDKKGWGKVVIIDHEDGTISVYGHLKDLNVKQGDRVTTLNGDVVGPIDNTGNSGGHHLHFEIREYTPGADVSNKNKVLKNSKPVNPYNIDKGYLNKNDYQKQPGATGGGPVSDSGPGGDHSDDTFSVADATFPTASNLRDAYYRLAVKKGKTFVINYYWFKTVVKERDTYLESLPGESIPDQAYLDNLEADISQLYESIGLNQELFWKEYIESPDIAVLLEYAH